MAKAAIVFAISEVLAFVLWSLHLLPTLVVALIVLAGLLAGLLMGNHSYPKQSLEELRGGKSNSALLALMKSIDGTLKFRDSQAEIFTDWQAMKSDASYEEPQAIYPMEMRQ